MATRKPDAPTSAPDHLRPETQLWFMSVLEHYELEEHHRRLLVLAAQAWDRAEDSREAIAEHGLTYADRFGAPHPRPEVQIVRDSTIAFSRLIRELDLDVEAPPPSSSRRPPALRSNRRP